MENLSGAERFPTIFSWSGAARQKILLQRSGPNPGIGEVAKMRLINGEPGITK